MSPVIAPHPFDSISLEDLRKRQSIKWRAYAPEVLPMWVAEMDYPLASPIQRVLHEAIERSDTGYPSGSASGLGADLASWVKAQWGWEIQPEDVTFVTDVVTGISELLRIATQPGEGVVISPPVYPPFAGTIVSLGRVVLEAPLKEQPDGWQLDLDAIEAAYRRGARVHLLCSPENPTGRVHPRETLCALAELAAKHGVLILADEIHAPLTLEGATHHPLASVSEAAARQTIVLTSASKAWNLAGLKTAMMVATRPETKAVLARLPPHSDLHVSHFGMLAAKAAFTEGEEWLRQTRAILERNRRLLAELLRAQLPEARYRIPDAGYLAWLDLRVLGGGDNPAELILQRQKLALSAGPTFGAQGKGFVRLNFGTTGQILEEGVRRIAAALR